VEIGIELVGEGIEVLVAFAPLPMLPYEFFAKLLQTIVRLYRIVNASLVVQFLGLDVAFLVLRSFALFHLVLL